MARIINLPAPICQQGTHSSTFTSPPHDTYLSVPEVYDWHWEHSSSHPFFVYHDDNKATTVYWKDAAQAVYRIAKALAVELGTRNDAPKKPLVGLYSSSGTMRYYWSAYVLDLSCFLCHCRHPNIHTLPRWNTAGRIPRVSHLQSHFTSRSRASSYQK